MKQRPDSSGVIKAAEIVKDIAVPVKGTGFDAPDPQLDQALQRLQHAVVVRDAGNVIQLPLWYEAERGTPNSFLRSSLFAAIQGKDRVFMKEVVLASTKDVTVKFTGEQLNQDDLTVWDTLVHMSRQHPLGSVCKFSAHSLLKNLGLHTGNSEHKRLHSIIIRLTACAVEITHNGQTYFGSLIKSGAKDEITKHYAIELNPALSKLYGKDRWTALDWDTRLQLRRKPLAQALHGYYSSHGKPLPVKLRTLQDITGSTNPQPASFKRQVKAALDELVKRKFLSGYTIQNDLVTVWRS